MGSYIFGIRRSVVFGIVIIVLLITSGLVWVFLHETNNNPSQSGTVGALLTQPIPTLRVTKSPAQPDCEMQKQRYNGLFVADSTVSGVTVGSLKGTIKKVTYAAQRGSSSFQLMPIQGGILFDFTLRDKDVRVADKITNTIVPTLAGLAVGQTLTLSYNCDPTTGDSMVFVSVSYAN